MGEFKKWCFKMWDLSQLHGLLLPFYKRKDQRCRRLVQNHRASLQHSSHWNSVSLTTNPRYNKSQSFCGERKMYNCFNIFLEAAFHRKSSNKFHSIFLYVMIHSHTMHQQKKIHSTPRSILTHHPKQLKFSKLPPPMVVATAADLVRKQFQNMISFWKAA